MDEYEIADAPPDVVKKELSEHSELLQQLLFNKGIRTAEEARDFLIPDYDFQTHSPFLLKNIDSAIERIKRAIDGNEKVVIYSDFDADGIPGAVILHDFFKKVRFKNFTNYIPHRNNEGFGLNTEAVECFAGDGVDLIITIDCGMGDFERVRLANEKGIDVIITDHHLPNHVVPDAFAIINPNNNDCTYPFKGLCGSGVIYKLVQGLLEKHREEWGVHAGWEKWLLDMVGIATLSDMVPLVGENRALAHYGLHVLRKSPRVGLQQLLKKIRINQRFISEEDVTFMITPRINAASRMDHPEEAFFALTAIDEVDAVTHANHLDKINNERKGAVASMVKEIKKKLLETQVKGVIVVGNPDWKPGLLGLAANTIAKEYQRPTFVWGSTGAGELKGSCRSASGIDIFALMQSAKDVFHEFGGHAFSGGFSIERARVHELEEKLSQGLNSIQFSKGTEKIAVDSEMSIAEATKKTLKEIDTLSPFGKGNERPTFLFNNAHVKKVDRFGKEGQHVKLTLGDGDFSIQAIQFFVSDDSILASVVPDKKIAIIAHLEKDQFVKGVPTRLRIVDVV
jgi:single-stranded-DNA-specific exonuclease